jgi:hypothetical protein
VFCHKKTDPQSLDFWSNYWGGQLTLHGVAPLFVSRDSCYNKRQRTGEGPAYERR